jgi:hypothetical protein
MNDGGPRNATVDGSDYSVQQHDLIAPEQKTEKAPVFPSYHSFPVTDTSRFRFRNGEPVVKLEYASTNWFYAYTTKGDWVRVNAISGKCILSQDDFEWDVVLVDPQAEPPAVSIEAAWQKPTADTYPLEAAIMDELAAQAQPPKGEKLILCETGENHGYMTVQDLIKWLSGAPQEAIVMTYSTYEEHEPHARERWMGAAVELTELDDHGCARWGIPKSVPILQL